MPIVTIGLAPIEREIFFSFWIIDNANGAPIFPSCIRTDFASDFFDNLANWQVEFLGEFIIARIMSGHGHNGTFAVAGKDIIGDPNWDFFAVDWINCICARKDARLLLIFLTLNLGLFNSGSTILINFSALFSSDNFTDERMLWCKH